MILRQIQAPDVTKVAQLIRTSLEEFGLDKPGTAYFDPQLDDLWSYYNKLPRSAYYIIEEAEEILGVGGFGPISESIAELQKLYVSSDQRGRGFSSLLLKKIFTAAKEKGYAQLYLETAKELALAVAVYEHFGFEKLPQALPDEAGHSAMDIWMIKEL